MCSQQPAPRQAGQPMGGLGGEGQDSEAGSYHDAELTIIKLQPGIDATGAERHTEAFTPSLKPERERPGHAGPGPEVVRVGVGRGGEPRDSIDTGLQANGPLRLSRLRHQEQDARGRQ